MKSMRGELYFIPVIVIEPRKLKKLMQKLKPIKKRSCGNYSIKPNSGNGS